MRKTEEFNIQIIITATVVDRKQHSQ